MQGILRWLLLTLFAGAVSGWAGNELRLTEFTAGTNSYSNVIITATSGGRVLIEYGKGMAAVRVADLELEQQEQLWEAGLVSGALGQRIERAIAKRESARRKADLKAARGPVAPAPELSRESFREQSIARLLAAQIRFQVEASDVELDRETLLEQFGARKLYGGLGLIVFLLLLRMLLFFRVCRNAGARGSIFVVVPIIRWVVLLDAAKMSKACLMAPILAAGSLFVPPHLVQRFPRADEVWLICIGVLWAITLLLYLVWCIRFCRAAGRSGWVALLLFPPVIDFLALFVLARTGGRSEFVSVGSAMKKPALAV